MPPPAPPNCATSWMATSWPPTDRRDFVTKMIEYAIRDCAAEAIQAQVTPDQGDTTALWAIAWRARSAAWMIRHRHLLEHSTAT
jgi:hypothetical protein